MKKQREKSMWRKTRSLLNTIHLWLGVGSGLIIFVVCLTGTIYTFSSEIQKFTDSHLHTIELPVDATRLPAEKVIAKVLASVKGGVVQSFVIPSDARSSYQVIVSNADKGEGQGDKKGGGEKKADLKNGEQKKAPAGRARGTTYFVNPYTGDILGTGETSSSEFFMVMFRMHRWLLLDMAIGRPIVGVATLIFVVMIITGMVIWFPKKVKNWKQGLKIKTNANWKRTNHDLHNALGLYASIFLLVMALTGLTWSFQWYKEGFVNIFSSKAKDAKAGELFSTPGAASSKAPIASYVSAVENVLPYRGDYRINLPADSAGVVTVMKTGSGFFATSVGDRITLDQYTSNVLATDLFPDKSFGDQVVASIKAIHIGSFAGTFSKILYFITCLIGTSLPVTGVIIWINKLRKRDVRQPVEVPAEAIAR
jgi:uncharacterized iron-regulated membrane protein